jgi:sugar/nucleoside kinase (ribokinase family)
LYIGNYCDIVIFSDFRHGIFTKEKIPLLVSSIPVDKFKVADSQVASRWGNILDFKNFDLITPNEREGRFSLGDQESTVVNLTLELCEKSFAKNIILKLGSRGSMSASQSSTNSNGIFSLPALTNLAIDPVGAGDALLAYSTVTLFLTGDINSANLVGATAASLACEAEGNVPIAISSVFERLRSFI